MTNAPSATTSVNSSRPDGTRLTLPKSRRLLKSVEFRQVYDNGFKVPCPCFVAFCWKSSQPDGPKIGFTAPRALGKATVRNRMKRRVRETIRRRLPMLGAHWHIVVNLRRTSLTAPQSQLDSDVEKVFARCNG
ncbi:ribonuclease P protein component [Paludibaculum fermentans]|uniref:ribonuclease P protein component n=1 Tax=Paludibaculum fermentans TaxID=1473598 RepID=UPI003EBACE47